MHFMLRLVLLTAALAVVRTQSSCDAATQNAKGGKMSDSDCTTCQNEGCCPTDQSTCNGGSSQFWTCTGGGQTSGYSNGFGTDQVQWCRPAATGAFVSMIIVPVLLTICVGVACCAQRRRRAGAVTFYTVQGGAVMQLQPMMAQGGQRGQVVYMAPAGGMPQAGIPPMVYMQQQQQQPMYAQQQPMYAQQQPMYAAQQQEPYGQVVGQPVSAGAAASAPPPVPVWQVNVGKG